MTQLLRSKNLATKFQIMVEIAARQPNIRQKDVAQKLGITSQAVSEYMRELTEDGWLRSEGRSQYEVTKEGVDWILQMSRQLHSYAWSVSKVVADISTTTAIADSDLSAGQPASLHMKEGILLASNVIGNKEARGIAVTQARKGQDVGIRSIEGVIRLQPAKVMIGKVPNVQDGGSSNTDLGQLKKQAKTARVVGILGTEALVAVRHVGVKPDYVHGVREAAIEAAYCGLPFLIVCSEDKVPILVQRLEEEDLDYEIVDLRQSPLKTSTGKRRP